MRGIIKVGFWWWVFEFLYDRSKLVILCMLGGSVFFNGVYFFEFSYVGSVVLVRFVFGFGNFLFISVVFGFVLSDKFGFELWCFFM